MFLKSMSLLLALFYIGYAALLLLGWADVPSDRFVAVVALSAMATAVLSD